MPPKKYKKTFSSLNSFEASICLALFAVEFKMDHCSPEFIEECFKKDLSLSDKRDFVIRAQQIDHLLWQIYYINYGHTLAYSTLGPTP